MHVINVTTVYFKSFRSLLCFCKAAVAIATRLDQAINPLLQHLQQNPKTTSCNVSLYSSWQL